MPDALLSRLARRLGAVLRESRQTVSTAESCTGGLIGSAITRIPGSSEYFRGGVAAYHNDVKVSMLGVSKKLLKSHGTLSREVAAQMALGANRRMATDWAVATTGIAGPTGGTRSKPVGLVYIAVAGDGKVRVWRRFFRGNRGNIQKRACEESLTRLLNCIGT